jgi:hypothetical protein
MTIELRKRSQSISPGTADGNPAARLAADPVAFPSRIKPTLTIEVKSPAGRNHRPEQAGHVS